MLFKKKILKKKIYQNTKSDDDFFKFCVYKIMKETTVTDHIQKNQIHKDFTLFH